MQKTIDLSDPKLFTISGTTTTYDTDKDVKFVITTSGVAATDAPREIEGMRFLRILGKMPNWMLDFDKPVTEVSLTYIAGSHTIFWKGADGETIFTDQCPDDEMGVRVAHWDAGSKGISQLLCAFDGRVFLFKKLVVTF